MTELPEDPATSSPPPRSARKTEDTASGCRDRAAASTAAAQAMDTANGQSRLQASADAWTARANLLERLETSHRARTAAGDGEDAPDE